MKLYFKDPKHTGKTFLNPHFYWLSKESRVQHLHQTNPPGCTFSSFTLSAVHFTIQVQPELQLHRTALNCLERDKSQLILNSWQIFYWWHINIIAIIAYKHSSEMLEIAGHKFGLAVERINKNYLTELGSVKFCSVFHKKDNILKLQLDWKVLILSLNTSIFQDPT